MSDCLHCGEPLVYKGSGRRPKFCSEACKSKAKRRRRGLGVLFQGAPKRPETPRAEPPAREVKIPRGNFDAAALGRAMAKVKLAEQELAEARAARAALDAEPDPLDRHEFRTFGSVEEMHRGGASTSPGIDTEAVAEAIRERFEQTPE